MSPSKVKEEYLLATNEETSEEKLYEIWSNSKSIKVRKAVATNPNAGPKVLKAAARLYLEEVLVNPGFTVLELFDDDPWITKLSMAYSDPWAFLFTNNWIHLTYNPGNQGWDHFGWAALLSPKLSPTLMEIVLKTLSVTTLRRALKNRDLASKLEALYDSAEDSDEVWPFSLQSMMVMRRESIISAEKFFRGLSNFAPGSATAQKNSYIKYIRSLHDSYRNAKNLSEKEFVPRLLAKLMLVSKHFTSAWIRKEYNYSDESEWAGELHCDVLRHLLDAPERSKYRAKGAIKASGNVVSHFLHRKLTTSPISSEEITKTYNFIKSLGLHNKNLAEVGLSISKKSWMEELDKCSIEVKEFFCRAGCLGDWVGATGLDDVKYKIISDVNEHIYSKDGVEKSSLLFSSCSIRGVVHITPGFYKNCY